MLVISHISYWLIKFEFVLEEPLHRSTTLNYQAATRFIEHSLPDLTSGKSSITFFVIGTFLSFVISYFLKINIAVCRTAEKHEEYQ